MRAFTLLLTLVLLGSLLLGVVPNSVSGTGGDIDINENMPKVPVENVQYVHPWSVVEAKTLFFKEYMGDWNFITGEDPNYTGIPFELPYPQAIGVSTTILEDKLWINDITAIDILGLTTAIKVDNPGWNYATAFNYVLSAIGVPGGPYSFDLWRYWTLSPIAILDNDTMPAYNSTVLVDDLMVQVVDYITNGTFNTSHFPSYLLDFKINQTSYIDLKPFGPRNISVASAFRLNCSRECNFIQSTTFYWTYYTSQKKYEVTLQLNNSMTYADMYDVLWFAGFPENRTIDPSTLRIYDLDNALYLTLGTHYDLSMAGMRMSFSLLSASQARSFSFTIYDYNASQGLGIAIAYADSYSASSLYGDDYYKAEANWVNDYGRTYQGQVHIRLNFPDGNERYIDPSSVEVKDNVLNRILEPWEFVVAGGLIIVDYATVNVGSVQSYDVYFHFDFSTQPRFNIYDEAINGISWLMVLVAVLIVSTVITILTPRKARSIPAFITILIGAAILILLYFSQAAGGL